MNERLVPITFTISDPDETGALGTLEGYWIAPTELKIVYVSAAPRDDDAGATVDIDDDGSNVISGIDASDANVPGTWKAEGYGGDETPVVIAAGSKVAFDFNNAAAANQFYIVIWALTGSIFS